MKLNKLNSIYEFKEYMLNEKDDIDLELEHIQKNVLKKNHNPQFKNFKVKGYSWSAQKELFFECKYPPDKKKPINWRETIRCPETGLNNRARYSTMIIDLYGNVGSNSKIYLMEQKTPLYKYLKKKYVNLIGSEYFGDTLPLGSCNDKGIRNEDATNLSFETNSLDLILSFDVFEHIPKFEEAFKECYRTLNNNGYLLFSVPFQLNSEKNKIRAKANNDGTIHHILEPEYHGDPINNEGILCFQNFGWEILNNLKDSGFDDAYIIIGSSIPLGNFGKQVIVIAKKSYL